MCSMRNKRACVECTQKCFRIHRSSKGSSSVSAVPSFFKVMLGDFTQIMYIPPLFARTIKYLIDTNIFLEDYFGRRWRATLCMVNRSLAFGHGWSNFAHDHTIKPGEFLVFRHISKSVFSVQIFAASGCERLHRCEPNRRNQHKRNRNESVESHSLVGIKRVRSTQKNHTQTPPQIATLKEERRERRNRSIARKLPMGDTNLKALSIKEEIPIIPPICAVKSETAQSLALNQEITQYEHEKQSEIGLALITYPPNDSLPLTDHLEGYNEMSNDKEYYSLSENNFRAANSACVPDCTNDNKDSMPYCDGTRFGNKIEEDEDWENVPLSALRKETTISAIATDGTAPKIIIDKSKHNEDPSTETNSFQPGNPFPAVKTEIMEYDEALALHVEKFAFSSTVISQSWLELPVRLPLSTGKMKQGRKVVTIRDPSMKLWPVLYYESSRYFCFITGWEDFTKANNIRQGDTCEFQLCPGQIVQVKMVPK